MAAPSDMVYVTQDFSQPMEAQCNFANQYDLTHPEDAMATYQRVMHEHTRQQFEIATASSRRRGSPAEHMGALRPETSNSSVHSTAS
ncbi:hypothetical protein M8818_003869 [Zalaria obscura]|uniref:Uncharacterized protein n=1 Tax=Zalaria obscura TaxID=2024903 RepID=A0ACC3SDM8_9PEZI